MCRGVRGWGLLLLSARRRRGVGCVVCSWWLGVGVAEFGDGGGDVVDGAAGGTAAGDDEAGALPALEGGAARDAGVEAGDVYPRREFVQ